MYCFSFIITRIHNLIENHEYEFRVSALNAAGQGPWSSSSDTIRCCSPACNFLFKIKINIYTNGLILILII